MNSSQIKQNWPMLLGGLIVLLAAGTTLWFTHASVQKRNQLEAEIASVSGEINRLRSAKVFPSEENIRLLKEDLFHLQDLYAKMHTGVGEGKIKTEPLHNGVQFVGFLRKHQHSLREDAKTVNVALPDSFAFGFGRYDASFPCRNPELKGEQCVELVSTLAKQVVTVEKICQILFQSKIQQLSQIRRVDIEGGQTSPDSLATNVFTETKGLYTTTPFEFRFSCDTAQLQSFLNAVAQSDWFLAVRTLKIETEAYTVTIAPSASTSTPEPAFVEPPSRFLPTPFAYGAEPPPSMAHPVRPYQPPSVGTPTTETRYRLSVTARIDLVDFEKASATQAIGSKKKTRKL